jgi:hypothetical protein
LLQQLAAHPDTANQLPFIHALQAIVSGSCDSHLADVLDLDYTQAAEIPLLKNFDVPLAPSRPTHPRIKRHKAEPQGNMSYASE